MKKKKGAEILWNNEKVEEKSGKKTILQIFLPKFHFSFFFYPVDVFQNTNSSITLMLNEQSRMEICNRSRLETEKRGDDFYGIRGYKRKMNCSRNANSLLLLSITRSSVSFSRKNGEKSIGGIHFFMATRSTAI